METGYKWAARTSIVAMLLWFFGATAAVAQLDNPQWASSLYSDHSLVGVIWDVKNEAAITPSQLSSQLLSAKYLLLGEKHDNPDHHLLQLEITQMLARADKLSAFSMEMMDSTVQPKLDAIASRDFDSMEALKAYLDWDSEGWDWSFYGPLVQAALDAQVPLYAGNISTETMREVYASQEQAPWQTAVNEEVMAQLINDIDASHCGLLPESQFPSMVKVQQARDAAMAESLPNPDADKISMLVAGNYHARQDLGVPNYLLASQGQLKRQNILSISFMEVSQGSEAAGDYVESTAGIPAYDYIWFTPAISDEDYCASMR